MTWGSMLIGDDYDAETDEPDTDKAWVIKQLMQHPLFKSKEIATPQFGEAPVDPPEGGGKLVAVKPPAHDPREEEERQMEEEQRMLAEAAADLRKELLRLNKCIKGIDKIVEFTSNTHSARIEIDSQYKPTIERHRRHKRREMHLQEASANTRGQAGERRALIRHLEATIGVMQHKLPEWRDAQEDLLDALEVEVALIEDVAADLANTEIHTFSQAAINTSMRLVTEVDGGL